MAKGRLRVAALGVDSGPRGGGFEGVLDPLKKKKKWPKGAYMLRGCDRGGVSAAAGGLLLAMTTRADDRIGCPLLIDAQLRAADLGGECLQCSQKGLLGFF